MAEPDRGREATHAAAEDASRADQRRPRAFAALLKGSRPFDWLLLGLAGASGLALLTSAITRVVYVSVGNASCVDLANPAVASQCTKTGFDQHSIAFPLLALLACAMGALLAASRAPGPALVLILVGVVAIAIAVIVDLPQASRTGALGPEYTQAAAHAGTGLWLELAGGALAIVSGALYHRRRSMPRPPAPTDQDGLRPPR